MTRGRTTNDGSQPVVLRQSSAVLVPVVVWLFCAFVAVDSLVTGGSPATKVRTVLTMASIAFLAWMFLASPCLVVERGGLRVVNPLRTHWVSFAALDDVHVRGLTSLVVRTASGGRTRITSWNAPGVPRSFAAEAPPVARAIEQRREAWEQRSSGTGDAVAVVTTWRARPVLALLLVVVVQVTMWWR